MDRKQFGKLVSALRQDMGWTQIELSQYGGVDVATISQMERGVKKHPDPELLMKLANVFQLTTQERRQFFLASTGIPSDQMVRQPGPASPADSLDPERSLKKMIGLVESLRVPAFLLDVYSDLLAINYIAFAFFQIPSELLMGAANLPGGMNVVRLIFGKNTAARAHILTQWEYYAVSTMRFFREASLCYRATPYFQYLFRAFRDPAEYPLFERYWRLVSSGEQDRDGNYEQFSYHHDSFGPLSYAVATTTCVTAQGELLMNQYNPTDDATQDFFNQLAAQSGIGVIRGAPWPLKEVP